MKSLIFFRHGKSDWNAEYDGDHDRPVSKRGRKAARVMGNFLRDTNQIPDAVLTSSARRAQSTVEIAHESGEWGCPVGVTNAFYESTPEIVLAEVRQSVDSIGSLLVAGHEPVWSETVSRLTGDVRLRFPTAAMARIDFDVTTWTEVGFGQGTLVWLVTPKLLDRE